jgi:hypothetical protein
MRPPRWFLTEQLTPNRDSVHRLPAQHFGFRRSNIACASPRPFVRHGPNHGRGAVEPLKGVYCQMLAHPRRALPPPLPNRPTRVNPLPPAGAIMTTDRPLEINRSLPRIATNHARRLRSPRISQNVEDALPCAARRKLENVFLQNKPIFFSPKARKRPRNLPRFLKDFASVPRYSQGEARLLSKGSNGKSETRSFDSLAALAVRTSQTHNFNAPRGLVSSLRLRLAGVLDSAALRPVAGFNARKHLDSPLLDAFASPGYRRHPVLATGVIRF